LLRNSSSPAPDRRKRQAPAPSYAEARSLFWLLAVGPLAAGAIYFAARGGIGLLGIPVAIVLEIVAVKRLAHLNRASRRQSFVNMALVLAITGAWLLAVGPRLAGYQTMTALSGSMEPTFSTGDLILVTQEPVTNIRVGQVISIHAPTGYHTLTTHRIVRIVSAGPHPVVETKGDANTAIDPWKTQLVSNSVWTYQLTLPLGGTVIRALRARPLQDAFLFGAPALLALLWVLGWARARVRKTPTPVCE
jgi:signal peptidase